MTVSNKAHAPDSVRVWAEVNLQAVQHNVRILKGLLKRGASLMAVVKSEAYGHGAVPVAKAALAENVSCFGVSAMNEAIALRDAKIKCPVQLLYSCLPEELATGVEADLTFSVSSVDEIKALADRSRAVNQGLRRGCRTKVHLVADTGMGRDGFAPGEIWPAVEHIKAEKTLDLEGIFTHFSSAEERDKSPTGEQVKLFLAVLKNCQNRGVTFRVRHAANSAGTVFHPDAQLDMVRCGLLLHGIRGGWPPDRDKLELKPSLSLHARIVTIGRKPQGWTVGYNRKHVCQKESLLATLPIGYSDGYRRALSGRGEVLIRGKLVPVVGTVSMNSIVVDITALENSAQGCPEVGEAATLIGGSLTGARISVEDFAEKSGTISYAVTTQLGSNVERRYHGMDDLMLATDTHFEMRKIDALPDPEVERETPQTAEQIAVSA